MSAMDTRRRTLTLAAALGCAVPAARARAADAGAPRVVTVGGALTEIVYALGAEALLVGTDTTSLYPEAARATPKVGYARALSAEGVLSLRPTVLIATAEAGPPAVLAQLEAAGVRLVRGDGGHSIDALLRNVQAIGAALGRGEQARRLAAELQDQWRATAARIAPRAPAPRVLFVLSHVATSVQVAGEGTAAAAMIALAAARNALTGFSGYRPLTAEAAVAAAPDFVLTTTQGVEALGGTERLLAQPGLALTPAARARRVLALDALYLLGFGPRMPQAVAEVARFAGTWA
jgi:iron complex transport system substrate-binding protein